MVDEELKIIVYSTLADFPLDLIDPDNEDELLMSGCRWRLSSAREDGSAAGSDKIGVFNLLLTMMKIQDHTDSRDEDENFIVLEECCNELIKEGLLQEEPDYKRENFKLITNEEFNDRRKKDD